MGHTIDKINFALSAKDFEDAVKHLKHYHHSIDNLNVINKESAEFVRDYIKEYMPKFSIGKTPLVRSLSEYLDNKTMKGLMLFSEDSNSLDFKEKVKSLDCYLDHRESKQFYNDHKCLKNILSEQNVSPLAADTISILLSHSKIEPTISAIDLKKHFTMLYSMDPVVAKVMDVSAKACKLDKCNIVFTDDRNYSSKHNTYPELVTTGYYDGKSDIFISSKRDTADYYGTFIHELTHYAMNKVYKNISNPYPSSGNKYVSNKYDYQNAAAKVDILLNKSAKGSEQKEVCSTIKGLKDWYSKSDYDCELVVRYPHMVAMGFDKNNVDEYLKPVEDYFFTHLIPDMNSYLVSA